MVWSVQVKSCHNDGCKAMPYASAEATQSCDAGIVQEAGNASYESAFSSVPRHQFLGHALLISS